MVGLERVTYPKISPEMLNPRDIGGEHEEEEMNVEHANTFMSHFRSGCHTYAH